MSSIPKVTVCLPTYNRARHLANCLLGILAQTLRDFEVIVSDNCSTDVTRDVVQSFSDPRIRYVRNDSNIGVFRNMNQCLELARGDHVCILHDDDVYAPRFLERESVMLDRYPNAGFVHCAAYEIDVHSVRRRLVQAHQKDSLFNGKQEFLRYLGGHNVCCSTVMVRRDLYRKTGGFDPSYICSDFLMWLQLALCADVAYVAEPLAAMRVHGEALSSSVEPARWCEEYLAIMDQGVRLAEATCPSLLRSKDRILRKAIRSQGKRFFIAAISAIAARDVGAATGFIETLRHLESRGLSPNYAKAVRAFRNPVGRAIFSVVRRLSRSRAAKSLPVESPWWGERSPACSNARPG